MAKRLRARLRRLRRAPLRALPAVACLLLTAYVIGYPLSVTRYPPMTDLPFHAASTSAFRHYFDPSFGFQQQFELHPFEVPYISSYVLGALLMLVLPMMTAVKTATGIMLALLPAGLAVMFSGMRKSPLLGIVGLPLVWCTLTHWGFINFVGALGLFAMIIGLTLHLLRRPSRVRQAALVVCLVALFFTHIFRFPFALAAIVGTTAVMWPALRRVRPVLAPLGIAAALFGLWWWVRPLSLRPDWGSMAFDTARLQQIPTFLFSGFTGDAERVLAGRALIAAIAFAVGASATRTFRLVQPSMRPRRRDQWAFDIGVTIIPIACALTFLMLFLTLPLSAGIWFYIYPRECLAAAFICLGALPNLPRAPTLRWASLALMAIVAIPFGTLVARQYAEFDRVTEDFYAVTRQIPKAPRLLYLVFDHGGTHRTTTPFLHLPAYVQAERGGTLSFHFATWGAHPLRYRVDGAAVPPVFPPRWEWTPQRFDARRDAEFFDWFLIRRRDSPDALLAPDPSIQRVDHIGTWWLYHRVPSATPALEKP